MQRKKTVYKGLQFIDVWYTDTSLTSPDYFRISEFPTRLTAGKNLFKLIGNPTTLKVGGYLNLEILDYNENLYDLIQNAKVVVGYPFTSPVLIAKELGVFSAFYSSSVLLQKSNLHNGIRFIQNKTSLERFLDSVLRDYQ